MPIVSRKYFKNNTVKKNFNLPIDNRLGTLTVNAGFQEHPSASINYEGVSKSDISSFERAYDPYKKRKIRINGIPYRVAPDGGYSYNRTPYLYMGREQIDVYTVTINLEGWWKVYCARKVKIKPLVDVKTGKLAANKLAQKAGVNFSGNFEIWIDEVDNNAMLSLDDVLEEYAAIKGCYVHYGSNVELKKLNSGSSYNFSWEEQISDGSNQLGVAPYFNGAELTWTPREVIEKDNSNPNSPPEFKLKEPEIKTESEYEQEVDKPPKGTTLLRSLDSNLDQSGPKKVKRTTVTIDGQTDKEIIETWGFAYYLRDFEQQDDYLVISEPNKHWKLIEYQETQYHYEKVDPPVYSVFVPQPRLTATGGTIYSLVVHPDYEKFIEHIPMLGIQFIASNAEYLTRITTKGWKLGRFQQEESGSDTDTTEMEFNAQGESNHPWWKVVKFQKINRYDETQFYIKSMRSDYEQDAVPYSIEWSNWEELDPEMQRRLFTTVTVPVQGSNVTLKVGLITADLDYVEPMLVWTESRQSSSITTMSNPDSTSEDPLPAFVAGEESYYQSIWRKKTEEYAVEKIVELTASGAGFVDGVENIRYREIQGRPNEAQYRKRSWEEIKPENKIIPPNYKLTTRYYLYSDLIPDWATEGGESISISAASTFEEALLAAETQLKINTLQSTQETRTVSWFFPNIEGGDFCNFRGDRFTGRFRVLSMSYTLTFDGSKNIYGLDPICTVEGTQLTLGLWDNRSIRVEKIENYDLDASGTDNNQGETPKEDKNATIITLGGVLPATVPNRRN